MAGLWLIARAQLVPQPHLEARHRKERVISRVICQQSLDGVRDRRAAQQRVGAVGLQVQVGFHLAGVISQDLVHRDLIGA